MDTLTHALSGALVARVIAARRQSAKRAERGESRADAATTGRFTDTTGRFTASIGRFTAPWDGQAGAPLPWQCVVVGLVAGAFPDVDAFSQLLGDITYLTHHRGVTHSVVLLPLWALGVAWLMSKCFAVTRRQRGGWKSLALVAAGGIGIHIAGDWITQFGTMLLEPFSNRRFGLGAMFIIDLVFSGVLLAGLALAALLPRQRWPAALGLVAASGWVGVAWVGQQEAVQVGERHARALGIAAPVIEVMPRPASPFNWTVSVRDGPRYHVAHVNTRREQPLQASESDHFIRRFSAPYLPERLAVWREVPGLASISAPPWVAQAWNHESFGFYRWFAQTPALLRAQEGVDPQGQRERCAWFQDLRFEFPGRDEGPFRFGVCLLGPDSPQAPARVFRLEGGVRTPV